MYSLKEATPIDMLDEPGSPSPTGRAGDMLEAPPSEVLQRGRVFFDEVYGKLARRIQSRLDSSGTEDLGLATRLVYGHFISNTKILSPMETSLVMIAGLIPQDVSASASPSPSLQLAGRARFFSALPCPALPYPALRALPCRALQTGHHRVVRGSLTRIP